MKKEMMGLGIIATGVGMAIGFGIKEYVTIKEKKLVYNLAYAEKTMEGLKSAIVSRYAGNREMFDKLVLLNASGTFNELRGAIIEARYQADSILTGEFKHSKEKINEVLELARKLGDMSVEEISEYYDSIEKELM